MSFSWRSPAQVAGGEVLGQRRRVDVGVDLQLHEPREDRAARRDPADPHPAADRLRQRVEVDDVRGRARAQPLRRGAVEAQLRVDAVVDDEEPTGPRELQQARAALRRQVGAGRVLAGLLQRDELDLVAGEDPLERVDVDPSPSTGSGRTRAPVACNDASEPANVGDSTTPTSPGLSRARATRSIPWRAPVVTRISSALSRSRPRGRSRRAARAAPAGPRPAGSR